MADVTDMGTSPRSVEASDQSSADGGGQQFTHFGRPPIEEKKRRGLRLGEGKPVALELSDTAKRLVASREPDHEDSPESGDDDDDRAPARLVGRVINIEA